MPDETTVDIKIKYSSSSSSSRPAGSDTTHDWNKDRCLNQFSRPKSLNLSS